MKQISIKKEAVVLALIGLFFFFLGTQVFTTPFYGKLNAWTIFSLILFGASVVFQYFSTKKR